MKRIYVDVDTQLDFCDPRGALFVAGAAEAASVAAALVRHAAAHGDTIIGSVDTHDHQAWEFATNDNRGPGGEKPGFPAHCVKGTWGWLKVPETLPERFAFVPVDAASVRIPARTQAIYFEKEVYSLFANPSAAAVLDEVTAGRAAEFVVFGVATDYCVRAAALGLIEWARSRGGETAHSIVTVVGDAIAGVAPQSTARALQEMTAAGVCTVTAAEVMAR